MHGVVQLPSCLVPAETALARPWWKPHASRGMVFILPSCMPFEVLCGVNESYFLWQGWKDNWVNLAWRLINSFSKDTPNFPITIPPEEPSWSEFWICIIQLVNMLFFRTQTCLLSSMARLCITSSFEGTKEKFTSFTLKITENDLLFSSHGEIYTVPVELQLIQAQ